MTEKYALVTPEEERLLLALGYLVVQWNYTEHFVRQLLRRDSGAESMLDPLSIKVSNAVPSALSVNLGELAKSWEGREGEPYIKRLNKAFNIAVDHRNHLVHAPWATSVFGNPKTAIALMIPSKIRHSRVELPSHVPAEDFERTALYFHELAMFARNALLGFDSGGARAIDGGGQPILPALPPLIAPLPSIERFHLDSLEG